MKKTGLIIALFAGSAFCIHAKVAPQRIVNRYISVIGKGSVETAPDVVSLGLSIQKMNKDVAIAKAATDKVLKQINQVFQNLNIPDNKINTSRLLIYPTYNYIKGKQVLRGYKVTREIKLTKIDINTLNSLIQNSIKAGVNNISQITLGTTIKEKLTQRALLKAAENAKARAKLLAVSFNATLGNVRSISTSDINIQSPYINTSSVMNRLSFADDNSLPKTQTGSIKITAEVKTVFDIKIITHAQGL